MTGTLISLISIFIGIVGANLMGYFKKKYALGFTGNTLVGVFGSILLVKSFGRIGFSPWDIIYNDGFNINLFIINCVVSFLGGALGVVVVKKIMKKLNKADTPRE
ncbi:hypothetical protein BZARG_355 [Bizionia argentinensis JUB59]|uniref:GlsB/YeaQ/YmgE family stress response membrane protein n=1 Tax=Bizionia argentinensis JUB59 TaxID=1046627 RepID=G2E9Z4_9FLAO|nr:hypothetical protein [Bizionia argentinensis]EGV45041.1 hypothetical protein BZARG_355 [Bizionia argentinensis JUB59]